jgi:hypothetical protein
MSEIKCRNCGNGQADDDGGCLKCHEPAIVKTKSVLKVVKPEADSQTPSVEPKPRTATKKKTAAKSQATLLIDLTTGCQKWHSPDGVGYVSMIVGEHREHWPIKSSSFRRWLQREYYGKCKGVVNAQALQDAIGVLEGKAMFDGREYPVHLRLAEHDGNIYIDLCDAAWRAVEITPKGWRVVMDSPVKFRRCKAMLSLPEPVLGGTVEELCQQLNISANDWPLVVGWILAALRLKGPFPVLNLYAEQGAGKTTAARKIRALIDPNTAPMRSEPKEPRDLMIAANNGWVIALDNLSHVSGWMSDALCRLSTGGGFSTRELYSDQEEVIFDAQRPVILTGIEELATRGDLLDRSLIVTLPNIPEDRRRPEGLIWQSFDEAKPRLLGVLYNAVAVALCNLSRTTMSSLPRMADFALWATAAEPGIGLHTGDFMLAYNGNRTAGNELALEASPVGKIVIDFMATTSLWNGTATELLTELDKMVEERTRKLRGWPQTGQKLSGILKRLSPNLRATGVEVELGRTKKGRFVSLTRTVGKSGDTSVTNVTIPEKQGGLWPAGDAKVTQDNAGVTQEQPENVAGDDGDDAIPLLSGGIYDGEEVYQDETF